MPKYDGVTLLNYEQIKEHLQSKVAVLHDKIIKDLCYIGEACCKKAREVHANDWQDRTGNLRSSVGYVVLHDGKPVKYGETKKYLNGDEGEANVIPFLNNISLRYPVGYVLLVCAGMKYAVHVETRGRDVLTGAELECEAMVNRMFKELMK